jgi:hypothetical protein
MEDFLIAVDPLSQAPQATYITTATNMGDANDEDSKMIAELSSISVAEELRLMKLEMEKMKNVSTAGIWT